MTELEPIESPLVRYRTDLRTNITLRISEQANPSLRSMLTNGMNGLQAVMNIIHQTMGDPLWNPLAMTSDVKEDPVETTTILVEIGKVASYMRTYHQWHIMNKSGKWFHGRVRENSIAPRPILEVRFMVNNSLSGHEGLVETLRQNRFRQGNFR